MTTRLEDLKPDALVQGLVGREAVRVVTAEMLGEAACMVVYRSQDGALGEQLLLHRDLGPSPSSVRRRMSWAALNRPFADEQNSGTGSSVWLTTTRGCSSKHQRHERRRILIAINTSLRRSDKSSSHERAPLEIEPKSYWRWLSAA